MIHAELFQLKSKDRYGHGPDFQKRMHFINETTCEDIQVGHLN